MSLWASTKPIFGDEIVLRSIDWLENFPWRNETTVKTEKDKYEIRLHLKSFTPEEISVKIQDGFIVIEGKHDEKQDEEGFISRHFVRRYAIPEDCRIEAIQSRMSSEGILVISAPRKPVVRRDTVIPVSHERNIKSKL